VLLFLVFLLFWGNERVMAIGYKKQSNRLAPRALGYVFRLMM
jgi:hypothetical protein